LQDKNGDENWHLYRVELASGKTRDLTPYAGVMAQYLARSPEFPDEVILGLNHRNPQWHDIYRANIVTGETTLILEHERFRNVTVDNDFQLRFASEMIEDGGLLYYRLLNGEWQRWQEVPAEDISTTNLIGFDKTNETLYLRDSRGRNTSALVAINLSTNVEQVLAGDPQVDIAGVMRHPTERHIQAVSFVYDRKRWQILDSSVDADFSYLRSLGEGDFEITSRSMDDRFWVVVFVYDDGPRKFYLYDRQNSIASLLFTSRKAFEQLPLAKMRSAAIEARDGLKLLAYYSLPPASDNNNDGIPDHALPLVFTPHGGPWVRDFWGFHPWHQWLTNRGYAVLSVNFRASAGFGKAF